MHSQYGCITHWLPCVTVDKLPIERGFCLRIRAKFQSAFYSNFHSERWFIAPLALGNKSYRVAYKWKLEVSDVLLNINDEYNERDGTS